jgi:hypothetical protein
VNFLKSEINGVTHSLRVGEYFIIIRLSCAASCAIGLPINFSIFKLKGILTNILASVAVAVVVVLGEETS